MLRHVHHRGKSARLGEALVRHTLETFGRGTVRFILLISVFGCLRLFAIAPTRAEKLNLPPEAKQALEQMYGGDPDTAIPFAQSIEKSQPDHPLGYLLEAEARWWKIYCAACEIKWGMVDAWKRSKAATDDNYFALADRAIKLAEARLKKDDSAEMHLYAGIGWALKARLYSLRDEKRSTARAGVNARGHFLHATKLDPNLADAYTGLGLYNYYVDTLSPIVKLLRFFMGIPGGNKKEGMRQLERAMKEGELTAVEARFYYAKNLRTYDERYERAALLVEPLVRRYPNNPLFLLLLGNLNAELSRKEKAAASFRAAEKLTIADPACAARVRQLAESFLTSFH
jgi:hypothetical protein